MTTNRIAIIACFLSLCQSLPVLAFNGPPINPYLPQNAVAAHPQTPYNLWDIPSCSRTSYLPCPSCGPMSAVVPDLPPVSQPIAGPFNLPCPVP